MGHLLAEEGTQLKLFWDRHMKRNNESVKLIIFGTGLFYQNRKLEIPKDMDVLAFIDNNEETWGKTLDGKLIVSPNDLHGYNFDKILLMSIKDEEMKQQLLELHVEEEKIITWDRFRREQAQGKLHFYNGCKLLNPKGKVLIISTYLGYSGAPLTALYAARALQGNGYETVMCAQDGNNEFIAEARLTGVHVVLCPSIPYLGEAELFWMQQFDFVLVNTFVLLRCACLISNYRPTIWWIHECGEKYENFYSKTIKEFSDCSAQIQTAQMDVIGVSKIARDNFNAYFPERLEHMLVYGIPDEGGGHEQEKTDKEKFIFAVIGVIIKRKGQQEFLEAAKRFGKRDIEFWIIGNNVGDQYGDDTLEMAHHYDNVKVLGELPRHEMNLAYKEIDVVVCPSLEETMSITLTEGMMHGKICITTDKTGMADYIVHGRNGLICEAGNVESLYSCMKWVLDNTDKLNGMRLEARKTYEKYFTLDQFADRLEEVLLQAKQKFGEEKEIPMPE